METTKGLYPIDFVFMIVKDNPGISIDLLQSKNDRALSYYEITAEYLKKIIDDLIHHDKIFIDEKGGYHVSPSAVGFKGFFHENLAKDADLKTQKRRDFFWKAIPIFFMVLFGSTTIYFNGKRDDLAEELKQRDVKIDSLLNVVDTFSKQEPSIRH